MIVKNAYGAQPDMVRNLDGVLPALRIQLSVPALPFIRIPASAIFAVHLSLYP